MGILTFMATFLLSSSKFERQGGFIGICLGFVFVFIGILVVLGIAILIEKMKKK